MNFSEYSVVKIDEIVRELETSPDSGIGHQEAARRQKKYGFNELAGKELRWTSVLLRQFKSYFIYLLVGAAVIAFALGGYIDGLMILLFVTINAVLGFYQEYHSEQTIKLLKKYVAAKSRVRRDGREIIIESREVVPGDILIVEAGDMLSADVRFFKDDNDLTIDESALTGESAPVSKTGGILPNPAKEIYQAKNIGFAGTVALSGRGEGIVFAAGADTQIGGIAHLAAATARESVFEKSINSFSKFILWLVLSTLFLIFLANLFIRGDGVRIGELFIFSIALAVSVIPEALPVVTTFSLSRGALRLAKNKVVVKRLSAIEDLGSIEVLCSDKTGTLTENKLTVAEIFSSNPQEALFYANLASEDGKRSNVAFDVALRAALSPKESEKISHYKRLDEIPFDPQRRKNCVLVESLPAQAGGGKRELIVRGAPENVIAFSKNLSETEREELNRQIVQEGRDGRRVFAVAKKELPSKSQVNLVEEEKKDLYFLGMISFADPIKSTAKAAIEKAERLGIKIKILTGDAKDVAGAVAHRLGLIDSPDKVITGEEFDKMPSAAQHLAVEEHSVFARVSPEQKYKVIQLLREKREVGFLGEGINDAPALKIANVALVVQGAADIAQEAADIVLLQKSLEVIVDGIKEGREVFANTMKYIKATLSSNFGNFYAVAVASLLIDFLPMLPLQILLVNLLSDFPMIAIATDNVDADELKKPREYQVREIVLLATILGLISAVFDFIFFGLFYRISPQVLQTNWFMASIITELFFLFSIRTHFFFARAKGPSRPLLWLSAAAFGATIILPFTDFGQSIFKFTPPTSSHLIMILSIAAVYFAITEGVKLLYYRFFNHGK